MSIKWPQADLPRRISGGAETWDEGPAGALLSSEFFGPLEAPPFNVRVSWVQLEIPAAAPAGGTQIKAWNGSAWVVGTLKRWNGSAWVAATLKRWNGSAWIAV